MNRSFALTALLVACATPYRGGHVAEWISDTSSYPPSASAVPAPSPAPGSVAPSPIASYAEVATKIINAARADRAAYAKLAELTDTIGPRLSGSPELTKAIAWAVATMKAEGHEVRTEKVMVPHWVRGIEEGALVKPAPRPLRLIGLGGSVPTPKSGITAEVVVVTSWEDLEAKKDSVKGKIVLYNVAMPAYSTDKGAGYGEVAPYRGVGASRAAKHGAVGVLVRSVTATSLRTPHTGSLFYLPDMPRIPAAAVTVEDALLISRLAANGPVTVKLRLDNKTLPDAESANVIGELRGREKPDEIVVISGHLDSWDVGHGAHDDGAGCVMMMQAITVLKKLGLQPRRTIRVVLYTNEENGIRGGKAYAKDHAAELPKHVFAIEADTGGFKPTGVWFETKEGTKPEVNAKINARLTDVVRLLTALGPQQVTQGHSGTDVAQMLEGGVLAAGLATDTSTYFDYHHTEADTLDKVDPAILADGVAASAALAYIIADLPERIDAP